MFRSSACLFLQPVLYCFDDCSFASIISSKVRECDCSSSALLSQDCSYSHFFDIFPRTVTSPRSARQCTCVHSCRVKAGDHYCEKNLDEGGIGEGRLHQGRGGGGIPCRKSMWWTGPYDPRHQASAWIRLDLPGDTGSCCVVLWVSIDRSALLSAQPLWAVIEQGLRG